MLRHCHCVSIMLDRAKVTWPPSGCTVTADYSTMTSSIVGQGLKGHNLLGYPRYVWITYDWYHDGWWQDSELLRCDEDELALLLRRSLVIRTIPVSEAPDAPTDVAMVRCTVYANI